MTGNDEQGSRDTGMRGDLRNIAESGKFLNYRYFGEPVKRSGAF